MILPPRGGSELLYTSLIRHLGADWSLYKEQINLILSFCDTAHVDSSRTNVVWQHLMTDQPAIASMVDPLFLKSISHFVYVSEWQLAQFKQKFAIEDCTNHVIRNAIEPIEFKVKPKTKLKLIYTSMPDRGLEVLLDAFAILDREVELDVYSSNVIYGKAYVSGVGAKNDHLFSRCKSMRNVNYKGYALNKAIRIAFQHAHIFAYPSTFEETSCLSAIEAGAAGCQIVTTHFGALPETCGAYATLVNYDGQDKKKLVQEYAKALTNAIDTYWSIPPWALELQSEWFNVQYSWVNRIKEWKTFLEAINVKN